MVKKEGIVFIDSNIFVIDLRYKRDSLYRTNRNFIEYISSRENGITSIINLLEICGILSFNLNEKQLLELYHYLPQKYNIEVVPSLTMESSLPPLRIRKIFDTITQRASFGDAQIMAMVETYAPYTSCFVSWNAEHLKGKISTEVLTPQEFLEERQKIHDEPGREPKNLGKDIRKEEPGDHK